MEDKLLKVDCILHGVVRDPLQYKERHESYVIIGHTTQPISLRCPLSFGVQRYSDLPFSQFNELLSNETFLSQKQNLKRNESRDKRGQKTEWGTTEWERRAGGKEEKSMLCIQTLVNLLQTELKDFQLDLARSASVKGPSYSLRLDLIIFLQSQRNQKLSGYQMNVNDAKYVFYVNHHYWRNSIILRDTYTVNV